MGSVPSSSPRVGALGRGQEEPEDPGSGHSKEVVVGGGHFLLSLELRHFLKVLSLPERFNQGKPHPVS